MKLDLNVKEWVSLYGLLERQNPIQDKHLFEVFSRMRATLINLMQSAEQDQFARWYAQTTEKVDKLRDMNKTVLEPLSMLMDDEQTLDSEYPRRSRSTQSKSRKR